MRIADARDPKVRRRWLVGSLTANLGILSLFKYYGFFARSAEALLHALGLDVHPATLVSVHAETATATK